jgi:hypothetical protein
MHGRTADRHWVRETLSILFWGGAIPILSVTLAWPTRGVSLLLLLGYPALGWRIWRRARHRLSDAEARLYAGHCICVKVPQFIGCAQYLISRASGGRRRPVQYKSAHSHEEGSA